MDYKISAVYYLNNNDDIIRHVKYLIVKNTLRDWVKRYKTTKNLTRKIENLFLIKLLNNKLIKP